MRIYGNTLGLSPSETDALERLYRRRVPFDTLTTPELSRSLAEVSRSTGRQVGVFVDRSGTVTHVIVGDASKLTLPDFGRIRAAEGRLRGLRLIHTHLYNQPLTRDDIVDLTRLRLDLIAALCLNHEGQPMWVYYAHNVPATAGGEQAPYVEIGPLPFSKLDVNPAEIIASLESELTRTAGARRVQAKDGRAILVHVCERARAPAASESLRELAELARTAGVEVSDTVLQVRKPDPKFVLGKGRLEEVVIRAMQLDAEVLIFDRELSAAQAAAISKLTDLKVLDRTQLILDIFAQRAHSRDGKLQVELAQMKYLLPRLGTKDDALSRLTGGIGGRGPGETKLEIGKRRARERVDRLNAQLKNNARQRKERRRSRNDAKVVAIVGYTNAGKSTLLNALTGSNELVEDKLFATLDTRARRLWLPGSGQVVITDTVGFIRDLPKDLFAAFRATFEEAQDADLLLHVVDASDPALDEQIQTTEQLLVELELKQMPRIVVYNKIDRLEEPFAPPTSVESIAVSARNRETLKPLLERIDQFFTRATDADAAIRA